MPLSLINSSARIKVSSVLNRDTTSFGKQYLTDRNPDSCWNSEQGAPQFILIDFGRPVNITSVALTFQGGFAGKKCEILGSTEGSEYTRLAVFYPDDVNRRQEFDTFGSEIKRIRIIFEESTDLFGRITVYDLDVIGEEAV